MGYEFQKLIVLSTRIKYFRKKSSFVLWFYHRTKTKVWTSASFYGFYKIRLQPVFPKIPFHRYDTALFWMKMYRCDLKTSFFDNYGKLCWKKLFSLGPFEKQSHHTIVITLFMIGPWEEKYHEALYNTNSLNW